MRQVFIWLLNNSITAGWLVLAILILRLIFSRTSRKLTCILWALVAFRLICPLSIESSFSVLPTVEPMNQETFYQIADGAFDAIPAVSEENADRDMTALQELELDPQTDSTKQLDLLQVVSILWVVGFAGLIAYAIIGSIVIERRLSASLAVNSNIYSCDYIEEPFIFGVLRPRIYLPSCLKAEELPYVLAHEEAHLKRKDYLWKPLGYLLLSLYWFNPIAWIAYKVFCRDVEVACDEAVIQNLDTTGKAAYSRTLLKFSGPGALMVSPLAFGEKDVKHRIKNVLRYKKPGMWLTGLGVFGIAILAMCFLTNPVSAATGNNVTGDVTNLLLIGQNERSPEQSKTADSIILLTLDSEGNVLKLTSLPGNTYVELGNFQANGASHQVGKHMLKTAYSLGFAWAGDEGATAYLNQCITENFGIRIDGNIEVNADVFIGSVDALGGIDLELEENEISSMIEKGLLPEGTASGILHLDGKTALAYQYLIIPEESVIRRSDRQLTVLQTILKQCQNLPTDQFSKLLGTVLPLLGTDLEDSQLQAYKQQLMPVFASLRMEVHKCPDDTISVEETIDLYGDGGSHKVLVPDLEKCREILGTSTTE